MTELCIQITLRIMGPSRSVPESVRAILVDHVIDPDHWDVEDVRVATITPTRIRFEDNTMTCLLSITIHHDMSTEEAIDRLEDSLWGDRPFWKALFERGRTDIDGYYFNSAGYKIIKE